MILRAMLNLRGGRKLPVVMRRYASQLSWPTTGPKHAAKSISTFTARRNSGRTHAFGHCDEHVSESHQV